MKIFELPQDDEPVEGPDFGIGDAKFKTKPTMPAGVMTTLFYAANAEDVARQVTGYVQIIQSVLEGDDLDRFNTMIFGTEHRVPAELLGDVARWLVEEYTQRPSTPSSGSPAGSNAKPATSEDGSSGNTSVSAKRTR